MTPSVLGPYRIHERLGKGGMGFVYRAEHTDTGDQVAVKALNPQLAASEGFRDRFQAEIESLLTLRHNGIVQLFGYGEQDGVLFYAMELVDGPSLEDEIRAGRRFDWRETTHVAIQLCRALKHAHDHGVIHRDIKPANVLLGPRSDAKLADFGIARLFGGTGLTISGGVLGTADYMAPEQAAGEPVTARADQYSLGGVMYALLAGRPPFRARDLPTMLQLQRYAVPESVRRYAHDTPAELDSAILQMLSKEPKDRFPNTLVLARHLEAMTRALNRPGADDFELFDPHTTQSDEADDAAAVAVTRDATDVASAPSVASFAEGTTPSVAEVRASTDRDDDPLEETQELTTRYTEVTDDRDDTTPFWGPLLGQAVVLLIAVATLGAAAWWWSTPLGADALFARIEARHERGDTDRIARQGIDDFLERFPDDNRARQVAGWRRELELGRMKKKIVIAQLARGEPRSAAPALLYTRALEIAEEDPVEGVAALAALAELLSTGAPDDSQADAYAELAREEAEKLREQHRERQRAITDYLEQRLKRARERLATDPAEARRVANGVLQLVDRDETTASVIDEARRLLAAARDGR